MVGAGGLSALTLATLLTGMTSPVGAAKPAASGNLAQVYVRLRTDEGGKRTYWLSRGTRYLLADFQITPLHAMSMASCVVADSKPDGSFVVRTLEGSFATDLETGTVVDSFVNPATGASVALPVTAPLTVTYHYHADGRMALTSDDPRRTSVDFRGALAARQEFAGELAVEERFAIRTRTATGTSDLSEQITFSGRVDARGNISDATKSVVVLRNWPFDQDQPQLMLLAVYQGRRFESLDALLAEAGAGILDRAQPGFRDRLAEYR